MIAKSELKYIYVVLKHDIKEISVGTARIVKKNNYRAFKQLWFMVYLLLGAG